MTLEQTLTTLKQAFSGKSEESKAQAAEITTLRAELAKNAEAVAIAEGLKSHAEGLATKIANLESELAEAMKVVAVATAAKANAEAKIESAGKKAAAIAASVGVVPVEISPVTSVVAKSGEDITAEWVALKQSNPKEASEFYNKHRTAILKAAGL
jgi:predicted  nucleic acid-binding Zn-ribbon protein